MTTSVSDMPRASGQEGITGLASYLLGAVPLIFFVYVLMLADDYALLRVVINQLTLGTLLVICIPLLPLWIAAAGILVAFALTPTTPSRPVIGIAAAPGLLAGLFAWSTTVFTLVTLAAIFVAVASRLGWSGWANVLTATALTLFILSPLFSANPPQAARDIILRGFPREVVFTAPGIYAHNRYDAYVLQSGDQVTAVVVDDDLYLPADAVAADTVVYLRNDSILDRAVCVPSRTGSLSPAASFFRHHDAAERRTPACTSVSHPRPPASGN